MIEENLELPFQTQILGVDVTVERVDLTEADEVVAICVRGHTRQAIPILELPLPCPSPGVRNGSRRTVAGRVARSPGLTRSDISIR